MELQVEVPSSSKDNDDQVKQGLYLRTRAKGRKYRTIGSEKIIGAEKSIGSKKSCTVFCKICKLDFPHHDLLKEHNETKHKHMEIYLVYCKICKLTILNQNLKKHNEAKHSSKHLSEYLYKCRVCGKTFHWKTDYKYHLNEHNRGYNCTKCMTSCASKVALARHMRKHDVDPTSSTSFQQLSESVGGGAEEQTVQSPAEAHGNNDNEVQLNLDSFSPNVDHTYSNSHKSRPKRKIKDLTSVTKQKQKLSRVDAHSHNLKSGGKIQKYVGVKKSIGAEKSIGSKTSCTVYCKICKLTFLNQYLLRKHNEAKHRSKHIPWYRYKCKVCGKTFHWKTDYKYHLNEHNRGYNCTKCMTSCASKVALARHMRKHDVDPTSSTSLQQLSESVAAEGQHILLQAEVPSKDNDDQLQAEVPSKDNDDQLQNDVPSKDNDDQLQNEVPSNGNDDQLQNELPSSSKENDDQVKQGLQYLRTRAKGRKYKGTVFCKICKLDFSHHDLLKEHNETKHRHMEIYFVYCKICKLNLLNQSLLNKHNEAKHRSKYMPEDRYKCRVCGKTFNWKTDYKYHLNEHNRGYNCTKCMTSCASKVALARHMRKHDVDPTSSTSFQQLSESVGGGGAEQTVQSPAEAHGNNDNEVQLNLENHDEDQPEATSNNNDDQLNLETHENNNEVQLQTDPGNSSNVQVKLEPPNNEVQLNLDSFIPNNEVQLNLDSFIPNNEDQFQAEASTNPLNTRESEQNLLAIIKQEEIMNYAHHMVREPSYFMPKQPPKRFANLGRQGIKRKTAARKKSAQEISTQPRPVVPNFQPLQKKIKIEVGDICSEKEELKQNHDEEVGEFCSVEQKVDRNRENELRRLSTLPMENTTRSPCETKFEKEKRNQQNATLESSQLQNNQHGLNNNASAQVEINNEPDQTLQAVKNQQSKDNRQKLRKAMLRWRQETNRLADLRKLSIIRKNIREQYRVPNSLNVEHQKKNLQHELNPDALAACKELGVRSTQEIPQLTHNKDLDDSQRLPIIRENIIKNKRVAQSQEVSENLNQQSTLNDCNEFNVLQHIHRYKAELVGEPQTVDNNLTTLKCLICGEQSNLKSNLVSRFKPHAKGMRFVCALCDQDMESSNNIEEFFKKCSGIFFQFR